IRLYECLYFISKFNIIPQLNNTISSVDAIALAQHYGVYTQYIDITSNLKTALFFACCKYGKDDKWHPLDENDFNNSNSRPKVSRIGGDSRYAILYRVCSELIDLLWSSKKTNDKKIIRPIGYQPFMRCSSQYGYALVTDDYKYDMMNDPMFEKIKIRLNTELCQKIYHEMHEGNDIYPFGDIPYIPKCINDINNTNIFTEEAFIWLADLMEWNPDIIRHELKRNGYDVRKEYERLHYHKIEKINKNYTLDKLIKKMEIAPKISPLFTI
ncbi:MAG: FRG domain-containing protein, partial [Ruminiclostridium sp.]|nr:FRG domain-containing protein [Ruminiclostridium sp.]